MQQNRPTYVTELKGWELPRCIEDEGRPADCEARGRVVAAELRALAAKMDGAKAGRYSPVPSSAM